MQVYNLLMQYNMKKKTALISTLMIGFCLIGCKESVLDQNDFEGNALIDEPVNASTADNGTLTMNGSLVYSIGSVFVGGAIANPEKGSSHRCHFYQEKFTEGPRWNEVEAIVEVYGFRHSGIDYNEQGQYIDQIIINGLDESLGFGARLDIPMNQGKYEGVNELIKDVRIKSFKFASYNDEGQQNKDADINIVITSTAGDNITIRFANDVTPYDGYY